MKQDRLALFKIFQVNINDTSLKPQRLHGYFSYSHYFSHCWILKSASYKALSLSKMRSPNLDSQNMIQFGFFLLFVRLHKVGIYDLNLI